MEFNWERIFVYTLIASLFALYFTQRSQLRHVVDRQNSLMAWSDQIDEGFKKVHKEVKELTSDD